MTDALSIGWTRAQAATRRTIYRRLLGFALIVQTALGLIALVGSGLAGAGCRSARCPSAGWVRLWGVMLLITAALYLPGWVEPVYHVCRMSSAFSRASSWRWTTSGLGQGLRWFALYELVFAVALAWSYGRLVLRRADVASVVRGGIAGRNSDPLCRTGSDRGAFRSEAVALQ